MSDKECAWSHVTELLKPQKASTNLGTRDQLKTKRDDASRKLIWSRFGGKCALTKTKTLRGFDEYIHTHTLSLNLSFTHKSKQIRKHVLSPPPPYIIYIFARAHTQSCERSKHLLHTSTTTPSSCAQSKNPSYPTSHDKFTHTTNQSDPTPISRSSVLFRTHMSLVLL